MRLLDQIMAQNRPLRVRLRSGREAQLFRALEYKEAIANCPVRYVLDPACSNQCSDLIFNAPAMFDPLDRFLRVSASNMWLEFYSEPAEGTAHARGPRLGLLVEADASGRRGIIRSFHEMTNSPAMDYGDILFDLDNPITRSEWIFPLRQASVVHLNPLLKHVGLQIHPEINELFSTESSDTYREFRCRLGESTWFLLPMLMAFSVLSNSGGILRKRTSDLSRLNRARGRAGKRPLLDHIEVGMALGFSGSTDPAQKNSTGKASPRLHYVKGHLVRRGGKTFWRTSHLRGDACQTISPRTTTFQAAPF